MYWDLEDDGIVNLKEDIDPGCSLIELNSSSRTRNGDGRLRYPGNCFRKDICWAVKISDTESKFITNASGPANAIFNSSVPSKDAGVEVEPAALELLDFGDSPTKHRSEVSHAGQVIGAVYSSLAFVSPGEFSTHALWVERTTPDTSAIKVMDIQALSEGIFEALLFSFPGYDLGISSTKIAIADDIALVRQDQAADHWFGEVFHQAPAKPLSL